MTDGSPIEWFVMAGNAPLFDIKETARRTGATLPQLQNWAARGIFPLGVERPGRHGKRMYSTYNLAILRFSVALIELGFTASDAIRVAAPIWLDAVSCLRPDAKTGKPRHFSDLIEAFAVVRASRPGEPANSLVVLGVDKIPARDLTSGDPVLVWFLGKLIWGLAEAAHEARPVTA